MQVEAAVARTWRGMQVEREREWEWERERLRELKLTCVWRDNLEPGFETVTISVTSSIISDVIDTRISRRSLLKTRCKIYFFLSIIYYLKIINEYIRKLLLLRLYSYIRSQTNVSIDFDCDQRDSRASTFVPFELSTLDVSISRCETR